MSNLNDFWGSAKDRLKPSKKISISSRFNLSLVRIKIVSVWDFLKKFINIFFSRLLRLPSVLSKRDRLIVTILLALLLGLYGYRLYREYLIKTEIVPAFGGTFEEVLIGEVSYLNPILAKNDTDKTINSLIYSGLTKIDSSGSIVPDLANSWEIIDNNKAYIFHLRNDVFWHDGTVFSSRDVKYTIEEIKNQKIKSPYYQAWKDVSVEATDDLTVIFRLENPYGPFIFNTLVGIIPSHVSSSLISSSPVGTGPYKFLKAISDKNKKIQQVVLEKNGSYWLSGYYIKNVKFQIAENQQVAERYFKSKNISAVADLRVEKDDVSIHSFSTSRYFGMVFNLSNEKFKNEDLRKKIQSGESLEQKLNFSLTVLDKSLYISQAEKIRDDMAGKNIEVEIVKRSPIEFQTAIEKRQFEAMLLGFDSGYDRDPYSFWHSSEINGGMNYSGFSDKNADILLEDARMTVDPVARNQKYDDFFKILNNKVPVIFYPEQTFCFSIKNTINGIKKFEIREPWDHLVGLESWYIKTKRVKP